MGARAQAKLQGLKRYTGGKPCRYGHVGERWVSTGQCVTCINSHYTTPDYKRQYTAWRAARDPAHVAELERLRYQRAKAQGKTSAAWGRTSRGRAYYRQWKMQRKYSLTQADYEKLAASQHYLCAVCSMPPVNKHRRLVVDHDHKTGKVRALLCPLCNSGLGHFRDSPALLRAAALYLEAKC